METPPPPHPFDAPVPPQIARLAEDVGVRKAHTDTLSTLLLAVLAGAFIALGAAFSTVAVTGTDTALPFGLVRIVAGVTFSLGLVLVVVAGAELFTGNNLLVMAYASRKIRAVDVLRNWTLVYIGNFAGAFATAVGMYLAGLHRNAGGAVGWTAVNIASRKCELDVGEAFFRGVYCNALVCLAVWLCMSCRSTGEKILAVIFPVTAFVAAGFEHSVANMYFIPAAILFEQDVLRSMDWLGPSDGALTWRNFFLVNLIPVTLGNIVGGAIFVGAVYWIIYIRKRPASTPPTPDVHSN